MDARTNDRNWFQPLENESRAAWRSILLLRLLENASLLCATPCILPVAVDADLACSSRKGWRYTVRLVMVASWFFAGRQTPVGNCQVGLADRIKFD